MKTLIIAAFFLGVYGAQLAVADEAIPTDAIKEKAYPEEVRIPESAWRDVTAREELIPVLEAARRFDPAAHLFTVNCVGDGFSSDDPEHRNIDGRLNPQSWRYWFRDPNKKEGGDIFVIAYDPRRKEYVPNTRVVLYGGIRETDIEDIAPLWRIDSHAAVSKAMEKASVRKKYFEVKGTEYELGYTRVKNTPGLAFVWKIRFSYKRYQNAAGEFVTPKDLVVYVGQKTGDILDYAPVRLEEP